jgi:RNA polymerase sigma-70 factor (ECF subfamily)
VEAIVRAAQSGDRLAMNRLLVELASTVGPVCAAIALSQGEDAMQQTMIAVVRNLKSLREPTAVHAWARRIATREAVRIARRASAFAPMDELAGVPSSAYLEDAVDVRDALAQLAPEHRAILVLRDLVGLTEAEAASVLDIAPGTVKSRLHRARAAFRKQWEE